MYTSFTPLDHEERFGFHTKGTFRNAYMHERAILMASALIILVIVWALSTFANHLYASIIRSSVGGVVLVVRTITHIIIILIGLFFYIYVFKMISSGKLLCYEANEEKIIISKGYNPSAYDVLYVIYYKDVTSVKYDPIYFRNERRGFNVEIICKGETIEFTYLYLSIMKDLAEDPDTSFFHIIEERAGLCEKPEFNI